MSSNDANRWMTAEDVAAYLQVEESTVKKWAKLGKIPHGKAGSLFRFDRSEVDEWVRSRSADSAAA